MCLNKGGSGAPVSILELPSHVQPNPALIGDGDITITKKNQYLSNLERTRTREAVVLNVSVVLADICNIIWFRIVLEKQVTVAFCAHLPSVDGPILAAYSNSVTNTTHNFTLK